MKKILVILLSLAMLTAMLSACATTGATPSEAPSESVSEAPVSEAPDAPSAQPSEEPAQSEAPVEQTPEVPAEMPPMTYPLCDELETISCYVTFPHFMGPTSACGVETNDDIIAFQEAEKQLNVHVEWYSVNFMTYLEQFNVYIAAGEWTDMISGIGNYSGGITKAYEDGVVIDMLPLLADCAPHYKWYMDNDPQALKDILTDDGVLGAIETYTVGEIFSSGMTLPTDMFTQWGNEAPTTYDELHDYMLFAKNQCGADIGMWFTSQCREDNFSFGYGVEPFAATTSALPIYKNGDQVKCGLVADEYRDYVEMLVKWYADGLLYSEFATTTWNPNNSEITTALQNGRISLYNANAMNLPNIVTKIDLTPINKVTVEKGGVNHNEGSSNSQPENICITTQAENPELCLKWIDYWFSEDGGIMYNYGIEGMTYDMVDGEPQFNDAARNNPYGDSITNYIRTLTPLGKLVGASYTQATLSTYDDTCMKFIEVWSVSTGDDANVFPSGARLTPAESEEISAIASDITTYATEQLPLFVMGTLNLEGDWDAYCRSIEDMNLARAVEIYQASYDRYLMR